MGPKRNGTPDVLGGPLDDEIGLEVVMGKSSAVLVDSEFFWNGYDELAAEDRVFVQQKTQEARAGFRKTLGDVVATGKALQAIKDRLPYGTWGGWLATEFAGSEAEAQGVMRIARQFGDLPAGAQISPSALALLAAPSVPQEVREEVIQMAMEEPVTVIETRQQIAAAAALARNAEADRKRMAVEVVMQWLMERSTEKSRADALMGWETPRWWNTLKLYVEEAGLEKSEVRSAVSYVKQNLAALSAQWGSAVTEKQAERVARDEGVWNGATGGGSASSSPERSHGSGKREPAASSEDEEERAPKARDTWEYLDVMWDGVIDDLWSRRVVLGSITSVEGAIEVSLSDGGALAFRPAESGGKPVIQWRYARR